MTSNTNTTPCFALLAALLAGFYKRKDTHEGLLGGFEELEEMSLPYKESPKAKEMFRDG